MEEEELYSPVDELSAISSMLKLASKHGLGAEVVLSALEAMKGDNRVTPVQAMKEGLYEWDI
jgi:hypothetical protein